MMTGMADRVLDTAGPLAVVIPAHGPGPHLGAVVEALRRQSLPVGEIIISHSGHGNPLDRFTGQRGVTVLHSRERLYAGAARNRGLALAGTEWVAFIDEDVIVEENWHASIKDAIERDTADCIVGSIGFAETGGYWGMVVWYVEFGSVHPYLPPRPVATGPSANIVIRNGMLQAISGFPEGWQRGQDAVAQMRLKDAGARIVFDPRPVGKHVNLPGLGRMLRHLYVTGRSGAKVRREFPSMQAGTTIRFPGLSLGLWLARLLQICRRVLTARNGPVLSLLVHLPGILLGLIAWNIGFSVEAFRKASDRQAR
jgi:glycosyltransferase involved in cell wall biosynthesis